MEDTGKIQKQYENYLFFNFFFEIIHIKNVNKIEMFNF
jgi:hypothetical protein